MKSDTELLPKESIYRLHEGMQEGLVSGNHIEVIHISAIMFAAKFAFHVLVESVEIDIAEKL